jgi:hypothetical protein
MVTAGWSATNSIFKSERLWPRFGGALFLLRHHAANAHRATIDLRYGCAVLGPPGEVRQNNMDGGPQVIHFGSLTSWERAMSDEELKAELERLRQENAALKKGAASGIRMKVSEKGAVSIYGMGRFPVTLYKEQWLKLLNMSDDIRAFITSNETQLKTKHQNK